jgi:hypothetical protein
MFDPSTERLWSARTLLKFFCDEMLPWFAANKPDVFNSFVEKRQVHTPPVIPRPHVAPSHCTLTPAPSRLMSSRRALTPAPSRHPLLAMVSAVVVSAVVVSVAELSVAVVSVAVVSVAVVSVAELSVAVVSVAVVSVAVVSVAVVSVAVVSVAGVSAVVVSVAAVSVAVVSVALVSVAVVSVAVVGVAVVSVAVVSVVVRGGGERGGGERSGGERGGAERGHPFAPPRPAPARLLAFLPHLTSPRPTPRQVASINEYKQIAFSTDIAGDGGCDEIILFMHFTGAHIDITLSAGAGTPLGLELETARGRLVPD